MTVNIIVLFEVQVKVHSRFPAVQMTFDVCISGFYVVVGLCVVNAFNLSSNIS